MVEFALVAPILFLLIFGIVDFGRALNYYNDLTQLAGQGARSAAVNFNPSGSAVGAANADCPAQATPATTIQCQLIKTYTTTKELKDGISVCLGSMDAAGTISGVPAGGQPVTVRATYTFTFLPFLHSLLHVLSIRLVATQSERSEVVKPTYADGALQGPNATAGGDACTR